MDEYLKDKEFSHELIVVDDGSSDDTVSKALKFTDTIKELRVIQSYPNRGKGFVLRKAVLEAEGQYIMFMDADSATSISELDKFLPLLADDHNIYIASRRIEGAKVEAPMDRKVMGGIYILFSRIILGLKVSDINCGFKIFDRKTAQKLFREQLMDDWSFDAEVLYLSRKNGSSIKEVPIKWEHKTTSKVRPLQDGIKSFTSLVRIKLNDMRGKYQG